MMRTGGGSPKNLQLTAIENALTNFLTPDAAGLSNVFEGGFENIISSNNSRQDQYYSSHVLPVEDENYLDKIYLSDSSEDLTLHSTSQTKRMQSPFLDKKQPIKKCRTLDSLLENKENIQLCIKHF